MGSINKILVAEDNIADVELVKIVLYDLPVDIEVVHFPNGKELMEYLKANSLQNINLILLDLNMPKMGGVDVLKEMYQDTELRKIPVVVFSSSLHEEDITNCYDYGANAYVKKPINMDEFNRSIEAIVNFWVGINVLPCLE